MILEWVPDHLIYSILLEIEMDIPSDAAFEQFSDASLLGTGDALSASSSK